MNASPAYTFGSYAIVWFYVGVIVSFFIAHMVNL